MKIVSNADIQHVGTISESIDFGIDSSNIGILFRGFSDTLYSNKIGSIVREVTSNCFDSHREANIKDDVVILLSKADPLTGKSGKICFKDVGVGLSPDRIKNIYSKYFSSTKRGSNNEIGGFGIGAKSPLAYTDAFEVKTIYDGIEYHYIVHRGEQVPRIELLTSSKTDIRNGTEVILPVRTGDEDKFITECKRQLRFFDNISYRGMGINNNYKVMSGKSWIATGSTGYTDFKISICLGGVSYPLDADQVGLGRYGTDAGVYLDTYSQTTVALKFDVGDIDVTMSRESIEYNDRTIAAIKTKYKEAKEELRELYYKSWKEETDFKRYIDLCEESRGTPKIPVTKEESISIDFCIPGSDRPEFAPWGMPVNPSDIDFIFKGYAVTDGKRNTKKYSNTASHYFSKKSITDFYRKRGKLSSIKNEYIESLVGSNTFICLELQEDETWKNNMQQSKVTMLEKLKPLLLRYIIDNTKSYDSLVVPDTFKPSVKAIAKAKPPRDLVCARQLKWYNDYDRTVDFVRFYKTEAYYKDLTKLVNQGVSIVYASSDEEHQLKLLGLVLYNSKYNSGKNRLGRAVYGPLYNDSRIQVHKIAKSHLKWYKQIGALTIKEFLVKNYNYFMCTKHIEYLDGLVKKHPVLLGESSNVSPIPRKYRTDFATIITDVTTQNRVDQRVNSITELYNHYNLEMNDTNATAYGKQGGYYMDGLLNFLKKQADKLVFLEKYFLTQNTTRDDKAEDIIKNIIPQFYTKNNFKIKNYFNESSICN